MADEEEEQEPVPCTWTAELDAEKLPTGKVRRGARCEALPGAILLVLLWLTFSIHPHAQGVLTLPNGDIYAGELVAGIRNGASQLLSRNETGESSD